MRQEQAIGALLICLITAIITAAIVLVPRWFDSEDTNRNTFTAFWQIRCSVSGKPHIPLINIKRNNTSVIPSVPARIR